MRPACRLLLVAGVLAAIATPLPAEIISYTGAASAELKKFQSDALAATDSQSKSYPTPNTTLPLQVVARLFSEEEDSGGSVGAQFADPATASGDNPEEFAINLALDSIGPTVDFYAAAAAEETRTVRFSSSEVGGAAIGDEVTLQGRLFLDGALSIFSSIGQTDLSGAFITLHVQIVQEAAGQESVTVFEGRLTVAGDVDRGVNITADGDLPRGQVFDANLVALDEQLEVFRVIVLPAVTLDYEYTAIVGTPLTLRAKVGVEAQNRPGGMGVSAILGAPVETIREALTRARDEATAKNIIDGMLKERADPTGKPAFHEGHEPLNLCGLLGFEALLGVLGLGTWRRWRRPAGGAWASGPCVPRRTRTGGPGSPRAGGRGVSETTAANSE